MWLLIIFKYMKPGSKLILVGGFLGAGKTTLLATTARLMQSQGKKVGVITNDQASGLVDTHTLAINGLEVQEIAGSCFCCNFDGLMEAALYLRDTAQCEVIIAEPVGSCTDLSATLMQPLKAYYRQYFDLAPLTVLVDPCRLNEVFEDESKFAGGSEYIYLKQLEEADHLVVNKIDVLDKDQRTTIHRLLNTRFPDHPVSWISASEGTGVREWLDKIFSDPQSGKRIAQVDYDIYAEGEALMGWYNASFIVQHSEDLLIPWKEFNKHFLQLLQQVFQHDNVVVGHLKTFLKSGHSHLNGNLTVTSGTVWVSREAFSSRSARLILNIRAEIPPEELEEVVKEVIDVCRENGFLFEILDLKYLTPGRPEPTHRYDYVLESRSLNE